MKKLVYLVLSAALIVTLTTAPARAQSEILVRCYAHVADYYTNDPVQGQSIKFKVSYSVMLEPEAFPEQAEHYVNGVTNANGDCYLAMLIPLEEEWYDVPFPPEVEWLQASSSGPYIVVSSTGTFAYSATTLYPTFYVASNDQDKDGINENIESTIAEQYKPVLIKSTTVAHPDAQANLGNFENSIPNSNLYVIDVGTISTPPNAHAWGNGPPKWDTYSFPHPYYSYLNFNDGIRYSGAPIGQRPLYYHVYRDESNYYVQYWYWFDMNDIINQTMLDAWHEGDWEHFSIKLNSNFEPVGINVYQHLGGHTKTTNNGKWSSSGLYPSDTQIGYDSNHTHPIIYIAANSHASYFFDDEVYHIVGRTAIGGVKIEDYIDEVDYSVNLNGNEGVDYSLFRYDYLEKLGEVENGTNIYCHGVLFTIHSYIYPNSKEWLGYRGYCGDGWRSDAPPRTPFFGLEYYDFSIDYTLDGFGNDDISKWWGLGVGIITWIDLLLCCFQANNTLIIFCLSAQETRFLAIKARFKNNINIEGQNAILRNDSLYFSNKICYSLKNIECIKYSNKNRKFEGAVIGFVTGLVLSIEIVKHSFNPFSSNSNDTILPILVIPLSISIGHHIGKNLFTNWQEYDLREIHQNGYLLKNHFPNPIIRFGIKIPFR